MFKTVKRTTAPSPTILTLSTSRPESRHPHYSPARRYIVISQAKLLTRPLNTVRLYALEGAERVKGRAASGFDRLVW